jgi:hypothetical protein
MSDAIHVIQQDHVDPLERQESTHLLKRVGLDFNAFAGISARKRRIADCSAGNRSPAAR